MRYARGIIRVMKTSIFLSRQLTARRAVIKDATGYSDAFIYEHGLLRVEAEVELARFRAAQGEPCTHPDRYPNGNCRFCFSPPATMTQSPVPAVTFSPGTP